MNEIEKEVNNYILSLNLIFKDFPKFEKMYYCNLYLYILLNVLCCINVFLNLCTKTNLITLLICLLGLRLIIIN